MKLLLLFLAIQAWAVTPPYVIREVESPRDVQSITDNDRVLASQIDDIDLTAGGTVAGNLTISGSGNGIVFTDATKQTTAGQPAVISTGTFYTTDFTSDEATFNTCVATLTTTLTSATRVNIYLSGHLANTDGTAGAISAIGLLIDGDYFNGQSSTIGLAQGSNDGNSVINHPLGLTIRTVTALSAASHDFCVTLSDRGTAGTATWECDTSACQFHVSTP